MTIAIPLVLLYVIGPLLLSVAGARCGAREQRAPGLPGAPWDWRLTLRSALLYTLAFNLTFFLQELFLVLPKALTPGLRPTLFHNNHRWEGHNPVAALFQGDGALAILLSGIVCMLLVKRLRRLPTVQLFVLWMAYSGVFMGLPQVVIGAVSPKSDVGMAMDYLRVGVPARTALALTALALMPVAGWWLAGEFLGTAADAAQLSSVSTRRRFVFQVATLPALLAIPLIVLFRIPRELIEVAAVPAVVSVAGTLWVQASAWRGRVQAGSSGAQGSLLYPLLAVLALLLVFQFILRPGIAFY